MFKTSNSQYGEKWVSVKPQKADRNPISQNDLPLYNELGKREAQLKHTKLTYKHEMLKQLRETGDLDEDVIKDMRDRKQDLRRPGVVPKSFPVEQMSSMKYPETAIKSSNPLYKTSNNLYGNCMPTEYEKPTEYFPISTAFTKQFLGGNFSDTGLNTFKTPSRVHNLYDA